MRYLRVFFALAANFFFSMDVTKCCDYGEQYQSPDLA